MKTVSTSQIAKKFNKTEADVVNDFEKIISQLVHNHKELGYCYEKINTGYKLSKEPTLELLRNYTREILNKANEFFQATEVVLGKNTVTVTKTEEILCLTKGFLFKYLESENWITSRDSKGMRDIGSAIKGYDLMLAKDIMNFKTGEQKRLIVFTEKGFETIKKKLDMKPKFCL